jgi:hypothetical protein
MNWIGIIQIVLIIAATGVSARGSQATGRTSGTPLLAPRVRGRQTAAETWNRVERLRAEAGTSRQVLP